MGVGGSRTDECGRGQKDLLQRCAGRRGPSVRLTA